VAAFSRVEVQPLTFLFVGLESNGVYGEGKRQQITGKSPARSDVKANHRMIGSYFADLAGIQEYRL
jgi:hypothetical protein